MWVKLTSTRFDWEKNEVVVFSPGRRSIVVKRGATHGCRRCRGFIHRRGRNSRVRKGSGPTREIIQDVETLIVKRIGCDTWRINVPNSKLCVKKLTKRIGLAVNSLKHGEGRVDRTKMSCGLSSKWGDKRRMQKHPMAPMKEPLPSTLRKWRAKASKFVGRCTAGEAKVGSTVAGFTRYGLKEKIGARYLVAEHINLPEKGNKPIDFVEWMPESLQNQFNKPEELFGRSVEGQRAKVNAMVR